MNIMFLSQSFCRKGVICLLLILIADFLFYGREVGWTLGIFSILLLAATLRSNPTILSGRAGKQLAMLLGGLSIGMMGQPNILNSVLFLFGMLATALLSQNQWSCHLLSNLTNTWHYALTGWLRCTRDIHRVFKLRDRHPNAGLGKKLISHYLLPVIMVMVFTALFAAANPVIESWLDSINWNAGDLFSLTRMAFWMGVGMACWAVIRPRIQRRPDPTMSFPPLRWLEPVLNPTSILYSLLAFNGLFIVQNALDLMILGSESLLPAGVTYAQYAHRGAYPLIVTALLAAIFVLIALKPDSATERSRLIRSLVYLWVGQNILLVVFSATRLYHYVGEYSLTYLRVAAFIWMGLVAAGLVLIVARIYWQKSARWLIQYNFALLAAALYICSFLPLGSVIAQFNVRHCQEVGGKGQLLDIRYLKAIGPEALPALRWYIDQTPAASLQLQAAQMGIQQLQSALHAKNNHWRSWTLLHWWLERSPTPPATPSHESIDTGSTWQIQ